MTQIFRLTATLSVCFLLHALIEDAIAGGVIDIQFDYYTDDCSEGGGYCDILFYYLLGYPGCQSCYGSFSPRDSDYFDQNTIDMSRLSSIQGLPNPWHVHTSEFHENSYLDIRVMDEDPGDDDYLTTFSIHIPIVTENFNQWISASDHRVSSDDEHYSISLKYRFYCDSNYYPPTCEIYCVPSNSSDGHYTCDPHNGNKICLAGWKGDRCTDDIDECSEGKLNCHNGKCVNLNGTAQCICDSYHTGTDCSQIKNQCDSFPCKNGGKCSMEITEFKYWCTCQNDWTGTNCETKIDPCMSQPCLNSGTCYIHPTEYRHVCTCQASWTGTNCEIKIDPCMSNPCLNNGTCYTHQTEDRHVCTCKAPWTGTNCESKIDLCIPNPCLNNGTCFMHPTESRHLCLCTPDWQGENCETRFDICSRHVCMNGGTCFVHPTQQVSICVCTQGWQGPDCGTRVNPCLSQPCLNGGSCVTEADFSLYSCECPESFSGLHCQLKHVSVDPLIVG